jgi:hypothetical protein
LHIPTAIAGENIIFNLGSHSLPASWLYIAEENAHHFLDPHRLRSKSAAEKFRDQRRMI